MTPDELRRLMSFLEQRVRLCEPSERQLAFDQPTEAELLAAGFEAEGVAQLINAPWWGEMAEEVVETGDFCEPDDAPEQVLRYARDVVIEYIRKRFARQP